MKKTLLLGGPGAGKTTDLVRRVEKALARGVAPERVAFVAFTQAAAREARDRAAKALGLSADELVNFRTLHSLAFRALGLRRSDVLGEEHLAELSEVTGELLSAPGAAQSPTEGPAAGRSADHLLTLDHYARTTRKTLREAWEDHGGSVDWFRLKRFSDAYRLFKEDRGVVDFTDMLEIYIDRHAPPVGVELAIGDESQDFTRLQWEVFDAAFASADEVVAAGDDDQSIHRWAGADEDRMLSLGWPVEHLPTSHRLPRRIFAAARRVIARVDRRYDKPTVPSGRDGSVAWAATPDDLDLGAGTWLLLARTRAQLAPLAQAARDQGATYSVKGRSSVDPDHVRAIVAHEALRAGKRVEGADAAAAVAASGAGIDVDDGRSYTASELGYDASPIWHDALVRVPLDDREYYLACARRGEDLRKPPRVRVETIHGAKGAEADRVGLVTDLTYRTHRGYELDPDSEHRVFYVGMTRASEELHLVAPTSAYGFPVP